MTAKSEVSRICAGLDEHAAVFRNRPLDADEYPYVFLDATFCKVRVDHRVVSQAVVIAIGVTADGYRHVLGLDVGDSESYALWAGFLRSLKNRGLTGVKLVVSDAHAGLKAAIEEILIGASWQRCRVHFMRNVLAKVPKSGADMVASLVRTAFAQPDKDRVAAQWDEVLGLIARTHPDAAKLLADAKTDVLAFASFPNAHWRQIWSTNNLERLNGEVKRRTDTVGIFPNTAALLRLATAVLSEQHDEWEAGERRYFSAESMKDVYDKPQIGGATAPLEVAGTTS